jgi:hypothetical protein
MTWIFIAAAAFAVLAGLAFTMLLARQRTLRGAAAAEIFRAWEHARQQQSDTLKIMEADKVLDKALKLLGFQGSLGDKLKQAGPRFRDVNGVWSAHKLRNRLAHELNSSPSPEETKRAMRAFQAALKDLGVRF